MKPTQKAQLKKLRQQHRQKSGTTQSAIPEFKFNEFVGYLRGRFFLTHQDKYADQATFEAASFLLDDALTTMVQQHFTKFTSGEQALVDVSKVVQATLVNSYDRDWRYFLLIQPALYDVMQFLVQEGHTHTRFRAHAPAFDVNFWRMITRIVLATNVLRWQGQDVTKRWEEIEALQVTFAKVVDEEDLFDVDAIAQAFEGLTPQISQLPGEAGQALDSEFDEQVLAQELDFAQRHLTTFQAQALQDVVTDNITAMLRAFHEGMYREFLRTHDQWDAASLKTFATTKLFDYWTPQWDNVDGTGGELVSYLRYLADKKTVTQLPKLLAGIEGLARVIDVQALNQLLAEKSPESFK
jgi:hypothetical protein